MQTNQQTKTVYQEQGYRDRKHYLECLSEDTGHSLLTVKMMADLLGEDEDFDGLVSTLEDYEPF
jgi:hypothetical protein